MFSLFSSVLLSTVFTLAAAAQQDRPIQYIELDTGDAEGVPALVEHLPQVDSVRSRAVYTRNAADLKRIIGDRPVVDLIDFRAGAEAVTAPYAAGRLLIVEFPTPQASVESDEQFQAELAKNGSGTVYRRIGNYNAFVFDVADPVAANALLDEVKYEKTVQWLGKNPFEITPERFFVLRTADIFFSTVFAIVIGMGVAIASGITAGLIFFRMRERRRAALKAFTDAGGMTRLNLDGFTAEMLPERMLK